MLIEPSDPWVTQIATCVDNSESSLLGQEHCRVKAKGSASVTGHSHRHDLLITLASAPDSHWSREILRSSDLSKASRTMLALTVMTLEDKELLL
jgi:hypothetical protein